MRVESQQMADDMVRKTSYSFAKDDEDHNIPLKAWTEKECRCFIQRFTHTFAKAAAVYSGVRAFNAFMKNPFRKGLPSIWQQVLSIDCVRFAAFLGLYPSLYHFTLACLRRYRKRKDGWNCGLAGGLAALGMTLEAPSRQKVLALFVAARALGAGVTTLVTRDIVMAIPYAETMAFCVCCALVVTWVSLHPHMLPVGYYHSVVKWSRDYNLDILDTLFRTPGERFLTCQEVGLHESTCMKHAFEDLLRSLPVFAKLYLPVHLLPLLLFKRKMMKERPRHALATLVKKLIYSTLFLSCMAFIARIVICNLRNAAGKPPPIPTYIPFLAGLLCGTAVLWERLSRRKELVLFLGPQMLHALLVLVKSSRWGRSWHVPQGFVLLFAVSMGVVMHAYEREPASLSMLSTGLVRFFVGDRSHPKKSEKKLTEEH